MDVMSITMVSRLINCARIHAQRIRNTPLKQIPLGEHLDKSITNNPKFLITFLFETAY